MVYEIKVPVYVVMTQGLQPTAKLVAIGLIFRGLTEVSYRNLAIELGVSRETTRRAMAAITSLAYHASISTKMLLSTSGKKTAKMPIDLYLDRSISVVSKLIYCMVQAPTITPMLVECRYNDLSKALHIDAKVVRRSFEELSELGWLDVKRRNRSAAMTVTLKDPSLALASELLSKVRNRLSTAEWTGEALMREVLNVLVDTNKYIDNGCPGYLENPETGHLLQYDRWYWVAGVAFEFNGAQHYHATSLFTEDVVTKQQQRDEVKRQLSNKYSIYLIVIEPKDLSVDIIRSRIANHLPLRTAGWIRPAVEYLDTRCRDYRNKVHGLGQGQ